MLTRMQQRRGTLAEWNDPVIAASVILQAGEVGLETDTGRFKIGNGTSVWQSLPYYLPDNNPSNVTIRQGKNLHDVYAKLSPLAESYSQTFTGSQVLVPNAADRTPLIVAGAAGQTGILQLWRTSAGATLASMDHTGKLTAAGGGMFSGEVNVNNNRITNVATPTGDNDAVSKIYVDSAIAGLAWKEAVHLIAHGPGTNVALTGTSGTLVIDGHDPLVQADSGEYRILLTGQTTATQNGIYLYTDNGTTYTLTRTTDADAPIELKGASVYVQEGTTYGTSSWVQSNYEIDSFDDQVWVQFSGAALINAGLGMTKDGNTLDVNGTADRITANADSIDIASTYVGQASITTLGNVTTGTWSADVVDETKGGTGQSSYTIGDVLYADTTTSLAKLSPGTASYALLSGGSGTAPSYGQIQTGAIANDAVTYDKLQNVSGQYRVLGRIETGAGNAEELTPDQLMETINQGITDISFSLLPVGTTSTTVAQGDHTHTLDQLSDVVISGTPAIRQVLKYNGTTWINELPSGGISIGATPPIDASSGDAWFDSTDGSLYVYYDDGVGAPRTNLVTNPSFEVNASGWTGNNGSSVSRTTSEFYSGTASGQVSFTSANLNQVGGISVSVTSGKAYTASIWAKLQSGANYRFQAFTGSTNSFVDYVGTGSWQRLSVTHTSTSTTLSLFVIYSNGGTVSHNIFIDAAMLEEGSTLNNYFDGSTAGASWTGTAHASTSVLPVEDAPGSAQWVQVKANSALEASILTRVSALEARSTDIEAANAVRVANATERDSVYPAPVQGNTVFRADLGYEEKYYAAYNATTNPDGTTGTPGWYQYAGGAPLSRNHVLNSHFGINQRNFSTTSTTSTYGFDRWLFVYNGGTATYSAQNFTTSDAPISNYESNQYARIVTSGQSGSGVETRLVQRIEDVTSLAGKTVTVSFWAKAASGTPSIAVEMGQVFGTGGSPSSAVLTYAGKSQISNSWNRYSVSVNIPSISGKVLGTNANSSYLALQLYVSAGTDYNARTGSLGVQNNTFDIWGVQLEEGPVPTPFRRNQPNIQAELAACQRYYVRITNLGELPVSYSNSQYLAFFVPLPRMRVDAPTVFHNISNSNYGTNPGGWVITQMGVTALTKNAAVTVGTASGQLGVSVWITLPPASNWSAEPTGFQQLGSGIFVETTNAEL